MTDLTQLYIDGRWQAGASTIENRNPSDVSDLIGHYAQASTDQLDEALAAARRAQPIWWAAGIQKRHDVLMAIGTELMARAEEIGRIIAREEGKPVAEGKGEVYRAGQFFTYSAAEALRGHGDLAESTRLGIEIDVRRASLWALWRSSARGISLSRHLRGKLLQHSLVATPSSGSPRT